MTQSDLPVHAYAAHVALLALASSYGEGLTLIRNALGDYLAEEIRAELESQLQGTARFLKAIESSNGDPKESDAT